jgi:hypothetical protein
MQVPDSTLGLSLLFGTGYPSSCLQNLENKKVIFPTPCEIFEF